MGFRAEPAAPSPGFTVVVIDDDARLCETLVDALGDETTLVLHAQTAAAGLALCRRVTADVVLLDQNLPDATGAAICPALVEQNETTKVVFMTAFPTFENAVAALKVGASDYIAKPFELEEVRLAVRNAFRVRELERIELLHSRRQREELERSAFVGSAPSLGMPLRLADVAAASDVPVLVTGETGTGKSLLARSIHYRSHRRDHPFVAQNCAAFPEHLAESELFGHEKGAFTGAVAPRRGLFEMAVDGTVFLDEIGAMALPLQAKLLGVIEDRTVRRIGSEVVRRAHARVVAATNSDLEEAVANGAFRQDLFYRLSVIRIHLPPLRERIEDLPALCRHLLRTCTGKDLELSRQEIDRLAEYPWPGNVRELANVLERARLVQPEDRLEPSKLLSVRTASPPARPAAGPEAETATLEEVERRHVSATIERCGGNLTHAAAVLGIALSTLRRKVGEYGLRADRRN
ncbi:MAG TPA: sigma-54 dependent transcriptional regulator [Thermoanaerobaculia bacterium]|nr:sigma-54 dependent transcriptional regulator [Thermoanaerobaculia bacterium]